MHVTLYVKLWTLIEIVWNVIARWIWVNQLLRDKGPADASSQVSAKLVGNKLSSGHSLARKGDRNRLSCILANSTESLSPPDSLSPSSQQEQILSRDNPQENSFQRVTKLQKWGVKIPQVICPYPSLSLFHQRRQKKQPLDFGSRYWPENMVSSVIGNMWLGSFTLN